MKMSKTLFLSSCAPDTTLSLLVAVLLPGPPNFKLKFLPCPLWKLSTLHCPIPFASLFLFVPLAKEMAISMGHRPIFEIQTYSKVFENNNGTLNLAFSPHMTSQSKHIAVQ